MKLHKSGEDYLEAILVLSKQQQKQVRSIDVAKFMGVSRPSISHAVALLCEGGFLLMGDHKYLFLTDLGQDIANEIYERHCLLRDFLVYIGVDAITAAKDACRMEHIISTETFHYLKKYMEQCFSRKPCLNRKSD